MLQPLPVRSMLLGLTGAVARELNIAKKMSKWKAKRRDSAWRNELGHAAENFRGAGASLPSSCCCRKHRCCRAGSRGMLLLLPVLLLDLEKGVAAGQWGKQFDAAGRVEWDMRRNAPPPNWQSCWLQACGLQRQPGTSPQRDGVDALHLGVGGKLGVDIEEDGHVDALPRPQLLLLHAGAGAQQQRGACKSDRDDVAHGVHHMIGHRLSTSWCRSATKARQGKTQCLGPLRAASPLASKQKHWILLKYWPACCGATL